MLLNKYIVLPFLVICGTLVSTATEGVKLLAHLPVLPSNFHSYRSTPSQGRLFVGCDGGAVSFMSNGELNDSITAVASNCAVGRVENVVGYPIAQTDCEEIFRFTGGKWDRLAYPAETMAHLTNRGIVVVSDTEVFVDRFEYGVNVYRFGSTQRAITCASWLDDSTLLLGNDFGQLCASRNDGWYSEWYNISSQPILRVVNLGGTLLVATTGGTYTSTRLEGPWATFLPEYTSGLFFNSDSLYLILTGVFQASNTTYTVMQVWRKSVRLAGELVLSFTSGMPVDSATFIGKSHPNFAIGKNFVVDDSGRITSFGNRGFKNRWQRSGFSDPLLYPSLVHRTDYVGTRNVTVSPSGVVTYTSRLSTGGEATSFENFVSTVNPLAGSVRFTIVEKPDCFEENVSLASAVEFESGNIALLYNGSNSLYLIAGSSSSTGICVPTANKPTANYSSVSGDTIVHISSRFVCFSENGGRSYDFDTLETIGTSTALLVGSTGIAAASISRYDGSAEIHFGYPGKSWKKAMVDGNSYKIVSVSEERIVVVRQPESASEEMALTLVAIYPDGSVVPIVDTILPYKAKIVCVMSTDAGNALLCSGDATLIQASDDWKTFRIDTNVRFGFPYYGLIQPQYADGNAYISFSDHQLTVFGAGPQSSVEDDYLHASIFNVWPNPASGSITCRMGIPFAYDIPEARILLVSLLGEVMLNQHIPNLNLTFQNGIADAHIPLTGIPTGKYLLVVQAGGDTVSQNIVVLH